MKLINIGFGSAVSEERIIAVLDPDSSPVKRIVQDAKASASLIDATYGRKTKSVIVTDSEYVILSAVTTDKIEIKIDPEFEFNGDSDSE